MQILLHLLYLFPTLELPKLTAINHRFQDLVLRVLYGRLYRSAGLKERNLVFECYPPSRKLYESYMLCEYLGTDGLEVLFDETQERPAGAQLAAINKLYSRFRPYRRSLERKVQWKHPAGDIPGSRTYGNAQYYGNNSAVRTFSPAAGSASPHAGRPVGPGSATQLSWASGQPIVVEGPSQQEQQQTDWSQKRYQQLQSDSQSRAIARLPSPSPEEQVSSTSSESVATEVNKESHPMMEAEPGIEKVKVLVNLDDGDSLHQLCANVSIFIPGPKPGIFRGYKDVLKDGVLRLWRRDLSDPSKFHRPSSGMDSTISSGYDPLTSKGKERETAQVASLKDDKEVLWVNHGDLVGIRLGVDQKTWNRPGPILMRADEDGPVSYEVQYEGKILGSLAVTCH